MPGVPDRVPSKVHLRIAREIARIHDQGDVPFVADLMRRLDYASEGGLTPTLKTMMSLGLIEIHGGGSQGKSRVVSLTPKGRVALGMRGIPVLGSIPAGKLEESLADPDSFIDVGDALTCKDGDFFLRVRGDSMLGDGIFDGDRVLLRPNVQVRSGEIAAVEVGDAREATLKHVVLSPASKSVTLKASNPEHPDIVVAGEQVRIAGVLRGLVRDIKGGL